MFHLRSRFKKQVFDYLNEVEIRHPDHGILYPVFDFVITENSLYVMQISIGFRLKSERPFPRVTLEELEARPPEEEMVLHEVTLRPGDEVVGEQTLFYTFFSCAGIRRSKRDFEQFVLELYQSPEQIRDENRAWWKELERQGRTLNHYEFPDKS